MTIHILGAGVAGLTTGLRLAEAGESVVVHERGPDLASSASWLAGGMLAPFCEASVADPSIVAPGLEGIAFWSRVTEVERHGTLVVAAGRDAGDLRQFAARTRSNRMLDAEGLAALEPDLGGRFAKALFFESEAHLDPRRTLAALAGRIEALGGTIRFSDPREPLGLRGERVVDCRGLAADLPRLRSVRGEMAIVRCPDVSLRRPVRLLHPRWPIYVVPRADHVFMIGATMVESEAAGPVTLRSAVELLTAAFALHPAFAEAEILEIGSGRRPALPDNLPSVARTDRGVAFSGLYRHGFLLSPAFSKIAADLAVGAKEPA
ncbi:FAD-dependent oxidoreductase [Aureimonas flava]|uniref:FAD-dependent oxidoreductase n=1 Tax=Aureimonas flava TaxID=2320271 RepID=A0A3A1WN72_9HYPH|nr:FAD-dependent oxidoreductase [Aureimonas flava]RIY03347.1 FAD-dependent oxidoreductase [Aureimonas flava]